MHPKPHAAQPVMRTCGLYRICHVHSSRPLDHTLSRTDHAHFPDILYQININIFINILMCYIHTYMAEYYYYNYYYSLLYA
jgi:hypothetical protein